MFLQFQFGICFLHSAQLLYTDCGFPRWSIFFTLPNAIFFYFLFNDFYQNSYKGGKNNKKKLEAAAKEKEKNGLYENGMHHKNGFLNGNCDTTPNLMLQSNGVHENDKKIHWNLSGT